MIFFFAPGYLLSPAVLPFCRPHRTVCIFPVGILSAMFIWLRNSAFSDSVDKNTLWLHFPERWTLMSWRVNRPNLRVTVIPHSQCRGSSLGQDKWQGALFTAGRKLGLLQLNHSMRSSVCCLYSPKRWMDRLTRRKRKPAGDIFPHRRSCFCQTPQITFGNRGNRPKNFK